MVLPACCLVAATKMGRGRLVENSRCAVEAAVPPLANRRMDLVVIMSPVCSPAILFVSPLVWLGQCSLLLSPTLMMDEVMPGIRDEPMMDVCRFEGYISSL